MIKSLLFSFLLGVSANASARCEYERMQSSNPVRSNYSIFVETFQVVCPGSVFFETKISNLDDVRVPVVYLMKTHDASSANRAHHRANRWSIIKYSRFEIEELLDGYVTQDEFTRDE